MPTDLSPDVTVLLLRAGVVVVLYLFLFSVVLVIQRELHVESVARHADRPRGRLIILDPGTSPRPAGQAIPLEPVTRLGRSGRNTVILDDEFVSAAHAMVLLRDGRWWVRDEGSTNGTLINGAIVQNEAPLREGDELKVGGVLLRLAP